MSRSLSKAAHYVALLDEARAEGDWDAVPELVRKVRKHAPSRVCLTLTAETELAIEKTARTLPATGRPAADAADAPGKPPLEVAGQLPKLQAAAEQETVHAQDRFQARVCEGWLCWVVGDYDGALARLPAGDGLDAEPQESASAATACTRVCVLKAAYLRANCLARQGRRADALAVFEAGLASVPQQQSGHQAGKQAEPKQLRYWSELFLTEFCMLASRTRELGETSLADANCLVSLRAWARYWEGSAAQLGGCGFRGSVPRRRIWLEYYVALSALLEHDLPYPLGGSGGGAAASARSQLRMELKRVEAVYETLLLDETTFPRADEERGEVEDFVRLAVQNWAILKGRGWHEADLGPGGRESASRGVLDMLYRASTKTYHSTAILRHLFTVHLAVAEFDLAFKAFDAYLTLVQRGKARVRKTGHDEPSLDADAVVLDTVAVCIVALCRYGGDRAAAEKALALSEELETCLLELGQGEEEGEDEGEEGGGGAKTDDGVEGAGRRNDAPSTTLVAATRGPSRPPPATFAACWQAVGLALAQWSRMTFDAAARSAIQAKAVRCLRRSLALVGREREREREREQERPHKRGGGGGGGRASKVYTRGVFALGLLLAEQRELAAAIELVKGALLSSKPAGADGSEDDDDGDDLNDNEHDDDGADAASEGGAEGRYGQQRAMIPLWHLLALLLSARQDYAMAARACEGAFEQFPDAAVLFGREQVYRSEHLNEAEAAAAAAAAAASDNNKKKHAHWSHGLVDDMDDFEKERILEVKMTQLALVELLESPQVAVNASLELLSLYSRLFGPPAQSSAAGAGVGPGATLAVPAADVPKSSASTLRSITGSLFGRSGSHGGGDRTGRPATKYGERPGTASRPPTAPTGGGGAQQPIIQVTRDLEDTRYPPRAGGVGGYAVEQRRRSQSGKRNSLRKRDAGGSGSSRRRAVSSGGAPPPPPPLLDGGDVFVPSAFDDGSSSSQQPAAGRRRLSSHGPPVSMGARQASQMMDAAGATPSSSSSAAAARARSVDAGRRGTAAAPGDGGVDTSPLALTPLVQFSKEHETRRRNTLLVEVWLLIAGFYRRAGMLDDAKRAAAEAQKLVHGLEMEVARSAAAGGGASLRSRGWAGKKSVDELWGDVWTELGRLSLDGGNPHNARLDFEAALAHFPDHPAATVGLATLLLDIYSEHLLMPHAMPRLELADGTHFPPLPRPQPGDRRAGPALPTQPLGLGGAGVLPDEQGGGDRDRDRDSRGAADDDDDDLPPPYKASSLPRIDRLAARDRAFALLSGLTKLGSAWNDAEAWFALARAHEESGQPDKAKEALWWCVELEEATGVRPWDSVATCGYVL